MLNELRKNDCVFAVCTKDENDGIFYPSAYFTDYEGALLVASSVPGRSEDKIRQVALWEGDDGCFYSLTPHRVFVDMPTRQEALSKLTVKERQVLGLE